jgi:hypothetical protein
MSIEFVRATEGSSTNTSLSLNIEVSAGINRMLIVGIAYKDSSVTPPTSVVWSGDENFTLLRSAADGGDAQCAIYYLLEPTVETGNVVITFADSVRKVGYVAYVTGAQQSAPIFSDEDERQETGTTSYLNLQADDSQLCFDIASQVSAGPDTATIVGTGTEICNGAATGGGTDTRGSGMYKAGETSPANTALNWQWSDADNSNHIAIAIRAGGGDTADTMFGDYTSDKYQVNSGEFTSTVKNSHDYTGVFKAEELSGITWLDPDVFTGSDGNKFLHLSSRFTETVKNSMIGATIGFGPAFGMSSDGTDLFFMGASATVEHLIRLSGMFTSTIHDSQEQDNGTGCCPTDNNNTLTYEGTATDKALQLSGKFTTTVKTSADMTTVDTSNMGKSWNGSDASLSGHTNEYLYRISGPTSTTIHDSLDVTSTDVYDVCYTDTTVREPGATQYTKTFAVDGNLGVLVDTTVDGRLVDRFTKDAAVDARLMDRSTKDFAVDAFLIAREIKEFAVDAVLAGQIEKDFAVDGYLVDRLEKDFTVNAVLFLQPEKDFAVDGVLQDTTDKNFAVDAVLQDTTDKEFAVDGVLQATTEKNFAVDGNLGVLVDFTVDARLTDRFTKDFTVDGYLVDRLTKDFTVDARLMDRLEKDFTVDAVLESGDTFIKDFTADAALQDVDIEKNFAVDARLTDRLEKDFAVNARLVDRLTKDTTVDAALQDVDIEKDFTVDAVLSVLVEKEFAVDGVLQATTEKNFAVDARLMERLTKEFTVDGSLQLTTDKEFAIDARLVERLTKTTTVDAILQATTDKEFAVDAYLVERLTKEFTADAQLTGTGYKTFAVDGYLIPLPITFTVDAQLVERVTKEFTIDAALQYVDDFPIWPLPRPVAYDSNLVWDEETETWYAETTAIGSDRLLRENGRQHDYFVVINDNGDVYYGEV